jgi:hypothetical protein
MEKKLVFLRSFPLFEVGLLHMVRLGKPRKFVWLFDLIFLIPANFVAHFYTIMNLVCVISGYRLFGIYPHVVLQN